MPARHFSGARRLGVILIVAALSVAACAGSGISSLGPTASPSAPPSATAAPSPSIAQLPSPEPSPTAEPSPSAAPIPSGIDAPLADGSIATVTVDALHLRAGASTTTAVRKTLKSGTRLFVIGEPKLGEGLRWHRVSIIDPNGCIRDCGGLGWVASPTTGTEEWLRNTPVVECPASPLTAEELAPLVALEALHCYGDRELTITGWIDSPCCGGVSPWTYRPAWLAGGPFLFFRLRDESLDGRVVEVYFPPDSGVEQPQTTVIMRATAHFDDPAASTCEAALSEDVGDDEVDESDKPTRAEMVLYCRTRLVITDYEVVGYQPGPGCGCLPPSPKPAA